MSAVLEGPVIRVMFGVRGSVVSFCIRSVRSGRIFLVSTIAMWMGGIRERARPWLGLGRITMEPVSATAA